MSRGNEPKMDWETAIAFATHCYLQLHPEGTQPEWRRRCTATGYTFDSQRGYVVEFTLTPAATLDAFAYFIVRVDPDDASMVVLEDMDLNTLNGSDFEGCDAPPRLPW